MADPAADRVLEALGQGFRDRAGALVEPLVGALTEPLSEVDQLVQPTDRGWGAALDLGATPAPAWYGNATGTQVPGGLTIEEQREYVRSRPRFRRGSPTAVKGAVAALLTGTRRVDLFERDGSPWNLRVRTYSAESAGLTETDLLAAAGTQKPVGITLSAEVALGASYDHHTEEHATYEDFAATYTSYDEASIHVPEEGTVI